MKIGVIGGNGKIGKMISREAKRRGHEVTVFVRTESSSQPDYTVVIKDLFDIKYEDVKEYDAIVNAFGVWKSEDVSQFTDANKHLSDILSGTETRLLVVGSAGSLYVDDEHSMMFMNTPEMPSFAMAVATEQEKALRHLETRKDVLWTYISPPVDFRVDGECIGVYQTAGDKLTFSSAGESQLSYADGAIAIVDEAENAKHVQKRFSIVAL